MATGEEGLGQWKQRHRRGVTTTVLPHSQRRLQESGNSRQEDGRTEELRHQQVVVAGTDVL